MKASRIEKLANFLLAIGLIPIAIFVGIQLIVRYLYLSDEVIVALSLVSSVITFLSLSNRIKSRRIKTNFLATGLLLLFLLLSLSETYFIFYSPNKILKLIVGITVFLTSSVAFFSLYRNLKYVKLSARIGFLVAYFLILSLFILNLFFPIIGNLISIPFRLIQFLILLIPEFILNGLFKMPVILIASGVLIKIYIQLENRVRKAIKFSEDQVRDKAHKLWIESGYLAGNERENWHNAELHLRQEWSFIKHLSSWTKRTISRYGLLNILEVCGILIIPLVAVLITLYDNNQRDRREAAVGGQEALKNYFAQLTAISLEKKIEDDDRLKRLARDMTIAFWKDPNVRNEHRQQVIGSLISMGLVQGSTEKQPAISLANVDLSQVSLEKVNLRGADLSGVILRGADLRGADLSEAKLNGADLTGANLENANLSEAKLNQTILSEASLRSAKFIGAELSSTKFDEAIMTTVDFRDAKLSYIDFSKVVLSGTSFVGASLKGLRFTNATLRDANLRRANLAYFDFKEAELADADLRDACLIGATFREANFAGAKLKGAVFGKVDRDCLEKPEMAKTKPTPLTEDEDAPKLPTGGLYAIVSLGGVSSPENADVHGATFLNVENLTSQQIKAAANWQQAEYDPVLRRQLGLEQ